MQEIVDVKMYVSERYTKINLVQQIPELFCHQFSAFSSLHHRSLTYELTLRQFYNHHNVPLVRVTQIVTFLFKKVLFFSVSTGASVVMYSVSAHNVVAALDCDQQLCPPCCVIFSSTDCLPFH